MGIICKSLTKPCQEIFKLKSYRTLYQTHPRFRNTQTNAGLEVVDVDIDNLFPDDEICDISATPLPVGYNDINNSVMSAVDIDPWVDEETSKQGTVDMESIENIQKDVDYTEPSSNRSGCYEFEGIKINLPPKILSPATYRYCRDEAGEEMLPDDIRICRYDK